jgi:hypothetical protein
VEKKLEWDIDECRIAWGVALITREVSSSLWWERKLSSKKEGGDVEREEEELVVGREAKEEEEGTPSGRWRAICRRFGFVFISTSLKNEINVNDDPRKQGWE